MLFGCSMAHPATQRPATASAPGLAFGRVLDTFVDPVSAFESAGYRPTWFVAFLFLVFVRFGSVLAFYRPEVSVSKLAAGLLFQLGNVFPLAATATILWLVSRAWRACLTYASAWCVSAHVMLAHTLVTVAIASVAGALLPESVDVELRHPPFTNLAFLVDAAARPRLHAMFAELDVRSLYACVLAWIGVRAASSQNALPVVGIVATCFALFAAHGAWSAVR